MNITLIMRLEILPLTYKKSTELNWTELKAVYCIYRAQYEKLHGGALLGSASKKHIQHSAAVHNVNRVPTCCEVGSIAFNNSTMGR